MTTLADKFVVARQLHQAGNLEKAEKACLQILCANPDHADAHHLLGLMAFQAGRYSEAVASLTRAIALNPKVFHYRANLGAAYLALNKLDMALTCYQEVVRLRPDFADGHRSVGNILLKQGRAAEAVAHFHEALRIQPSFAEGHNSLGIAQQEQGRLDAATSCFQQALRINPGFAEAHNNLGNTLERQGKLDEACRSYQEALRLKPGFADAHSNLGCVLLRQGQLEPAVASFRQALDLNPDLATAQTNLLACSNYDPLAQPDAVFAEHVRWGKARESASHPLPHANDPNPDRPLRIGYVSPSLCFHPLTRYLEPVLTNHDPRQFTVFCYAEVRTPDTVTTRLQALVRHWRSTCGLTDTELANRIIDDKIDILVDLAGHTANSRLTVFAHKPAPIQATWLGYLNTTGLTRMDYRLTDELLDPSSGVRCPESGVSSHSSDTGHRTPDAGQFPIRDTEELLRLPHGMCCFAPPMDAPTVEPLPAPRHGHVTFGSLNGLLKLNRQVIDLWSQVLKAVPGSRFLMFHHGLKSTAREDIRGQFADRGIGPQRLDLRQGSADVGYLRIYGEIDVSLDTFPATGGVTTCESLWMGVPVLTLCGVRPAGRNSAALLTRARLGDWVVDRPEEFVAKAVQWSNELELLATLRAQLRQRVTSTLCDARRFTRSLEEAYRYMWRRWCAVQGKK
jgi:protein O-GlcNAc transferase